MNFEPSATFNKSPGSPEARCYGFCGVHPYSFQSGPGIR